MLPRRLLTGPNLLKRAWDLGVNTEDDNPVTGQTASTGELPLLASEHVIQRRVQDAERHLRDRRLFLITMVSAALGAAVGIGGLWATIHNGNKQTENARLLLSAQLARQFREGFDQQQMQRHRAETARALLRKEEPRTDDVPDFFESVGHYAKQGLLDMETVWNDFGYTITHYWPALKAHVADARTGREGDPEYWVNFEWLNDELLKVAARHRQTAVTAVTPGADDVQEFLRDEAELVEPEKPPQPKKARRSTK